MTKKSIKHASSDVGMIFTAYNLRRTFNILDKNQLKAYLKGLGLYFWPFQRPFKVIFEHSVGLG
jgi:ABC-type arginine transport system ATPase subunit